MTNSGACVAGCSHEQTGTARGFSVLEALVAMTVAGLAALATAQLVVMSARAVRLADQQSTSTVLAAARLEQLQSLPWWFVGNGGVLEPRSDTTTALDREPIGAGGWGLLACPADSLVASAPGHAEYLDTHGRSLGPVGGNPAGARFVRRWSVVPAPDDPHHTLVLGVRVTPLGIDLATAGRPPLTVLPGETWLVTLRSRLRR